MRSLLFAPGDSRHKIDKALGLDVDVVVLDLEDSVAPDNKPKAREICAQALGDHSPRSVRLFVRVNGFTTGLIEDDLSAIVLARPDGIMLPKAEGADDIAKLDALLAPLEAKAGLKTPLPVIALATETARGVQLLPSYEKAPARLEALAWAGEDLSVDLGATTNLEPDGTYTDPYRLARSLCLMSARAASLAPISTVFVNYKDEQGLRAECECDARDGFTGKLAIHPAQVPIINAAFTPSAKEIAHARALIDAFAKAGNPGVIGLDGEMFDQPHLTRAQNLLARAKAYGVG